MSTTFGDKLRVLRQRTGLTQTELATQLNLASHSHIANLEAGRDVPSITLVVRVAHVFAVSTDYLLRNEISPQAYSQKEPQISPELELELGFGGRLRILRKKRGVSQVDLAKQLGVSRAYITNQEAGRKGPSVELVVKLADYFGVTIDYLLLGRSIE